MQEPDQAFDTGGPIAVQPRDQVRALGWGRVVSTVLSLLVIGVALWQARAVNPRDILALVPANPLFWVVYVTSYFVMPASEWLIFRRLWGGVGPQAFGALVRKTIYNELLLGYLGEAYFWNWARRHLVLPQKPFGAVKDVAVMSAMAGNAMTLLLLAIAYPFVGLLRLTQNQSAIGWSLAFVTLISVVIALFRGKIFSLSRHELWFVFAIHTARIVVVRVMLAILWAMVLPGEPLVWWLVLTAIRLLISRLPFIPNKDVVFAGVAVFALGNEVAIAALMTFMAALILVTHMAVGLALAAIDLIARTPE